MSLTLSPADYTTLVFDCDGVVLDSNKVKTEAFFQATLPYGEDAAQAMVDYHVANGGISRYKKFAHFLERIVPVHSADLKGPDLVALLQAYAGHVREGLLSCDITSGLEVLRRETADARWLIVSGGDQAELRDVFAQRGIAEWFDGGIFGSPDTKETILKRELTPYEYFDNALFLGDSRYDHLAAASVGLPFVFVSDWTEFPGWERYCEQHGLITIGSISDLLDLQRT